MSSEVDITLLRHGESIWNAEDRFAGWIDVPLSECGEHEARRAGIALAEHGLLPDVVHTSLLRRSVDTAALALGASQRAWIPVRRSWRLNERHYGALQGRSREAVKKELGETAFAEIRRSYAKAPPPESDAEALAWARDDRYRGLGAQLPRCESLRQVEARLVPYWSGRIAADLRAGRQVLVVAHGNVLRTLIRMIEGLPEEAVKSVEVPTGIPIVVRVDLHSLRSVQVPRQLVPQTEA